jgi:hypothetical protein
MDRRSVLRIVRTVRNLQASQGWPAIEPPERQQNLTPNPASKSRASVTMWAAGKYPVRF